MRAGGPWMINEKGEIHNAAGQSPLGVILGSAYPRPVFPEPGNTEISDRAALKLAAAADRPQSRWRAEMLEMLGL